jgi:hypothetical protein
MQRALRSSVALILFGMFSDHLWRTPFVQHGVVFVLQGGARSHWLCVGLMVKVVQRAIVIRPLHSLVKR